MRAAILLLAGAFFIGDRSVPAATIEPDNDPVREMRMEVILTAFDEGIDPGLPLRIAYRESRWTPDALSSEGAMGIFQIMPRTAEALGLDDAFDPWKNIHTAVIYIASLEKKYGSEEVADCMFAHGNEKRCYDRRRSLKLQDR